MHFNSLAPRGANRCLRTPRRRRQGISTHSPRVGRTIKYNRAARARKDFNSLAPRGANPSPSALTAQSRIFQLTRPAWGEPHSKRRRRLQCSISTHSPRVGRTPRRTGEARRHADFNSLAPRGANHTLRAVYLFSPSFQLTRPAWGEPSRLRYAPPYRNFNSLAPRGANPFMRFSASSAFLFQLTRPAWGEPRRHVIARTGD